MNFAKRFFSTTVSSAAAQTQRPVRVRYAPSPTGSLHIGGLRTALYNYLYAKKSNGKFILRIEDTDKTREVPGSVNNIIKGLSWAGLKWEEGPGATEDTPFGPYYQSKRLDLYRSYSHKLVEKGHAYYCFCSEERLQTLRESQMKSGQVTKYDGHCQHLTDTEVNARLKAGEKHVIRLKIPKGATEVHDIIHGKVKFSHDNVDDQVLLKSDGYPTYHLANVIDDHHMQISHVIRGEEWLTSVPKHLILYKALGFTPPEFAHLPLILNPKGGKLSKRHSHTAVDHYIQKDYLPEAVINFVAFLGWTPAEIDNLIDREFKDEVYTLREMERLFRLDRVVPSNAKLLENKLLHFNSFYLKKHYEDLEKDGATKIKEFRGYMLKYMDHLKTEIEKASNEKIKQIISFSLDRIQTYEELANYNFFFESPDYNSENSLKSKSKVIVDLDKTKTLVSEIHRLLSKIPDNDFNQISIAKVFSEYLYENKKTLKNEDIYHLLRYILTGSHSGGPVTKACEILGKEEVLKRITSLNVS